MQKTLPYLLLFIIALLLCDALFDAPGLSFTIGDEDFDGPFGGLLATMLAGGGLLIGTLVTVFVAIVLAVVFAGVSIVVVAALVLAAAITVIAISPLLLPLLIPVAIIWYLARRNRHRAPQLKENAA